MSKAATENVVRRTPKRRSASARQSLGAAKKRDENLALKRELKALRQEQSATADVLKLISRSTFDLQLALDTLVSTAARLCDAEMVLISRREGAQYRSAASTGFTPEFHAFIQSHPLTPGRGSIVGRVALEKQVIQIADVTADAEYTLSESTTLSQQRTALAVPLLREDDLIGVIVLARRHVERFTSRQIELARTFADQAVIAIENVRLFTELRESLEQQTATADILRVISRSPTDVQPVLTAVAKAALRFCGAEDVGIFLREGEQYLMAAHEGPMVPEVGVHYPLSRQTAPGRAMLDSRTVHFPDISALDSVEYAAAREFSLRHGFKAAIAAPMLREGTAIGTVTLRRSQAGAFTPRQIGLLETFAAQAVIAIENVRLFTELRQRTDDLTESLEYQTATSSVLKVISRSTFDMEPVLNTLAETALQLCAADQTFILRREGQVYRALAGVGSSRDNIATVRQYRAYLETHPIEPGRGTVAGRAVLERRPVHIHDVATDPEYKLTQAMTLGNVHTTFGVPLLRDGEPVGVIVLSRQRVEPFTDRQIELVRTFADQAVIAMENTRLFEELRDRQAELRVTFDNMGDAVAMFDADFRLASWNRNFQELLDIPDTFLAGRPGYDDYVRLLVERGELGDGDAESQIAFYRERLGQQWSSERSRPDGRVIEVRHNPVPDGGVVLIYSDVTERKKAEQEIAAARDAAESALDRLKAAQANLIQAEKMASLGQLTAGIAHEIKNPLNFVNNFSGLTVELLAELKEAAVPALAQLDEDKRAEVNEIIKLIAGNLAKIAQHGRRADGIIKSMLAHSRGGSGDWQPISINGLVEEALNLAYHGARAQDKDFNVTLERDFDEKARSIDVVPQDVTRVFLNLFGNGFYASRKRQRDSGDNAYRPVLKIATRDLGDAVEVRVRDNGTGIAPDVRDKLFQPFFTTKPTGEGTGLGLSISYDIVTQQHGGSIKVESEPGLYTEFTVRLPRASRAAASAGDN